ncbi:hypothetical protein [Dactylosporangium salmoneum]|uniref:Uncharacterized protein n=1 Tax=Dactylosporangium salmoneum TaxID=53361 RepID=A0ABN3FCM0_9ACTN
MTTTVNTSSAAGRKGIEASLDGLTASGRAVDNLPSWWHDPVPADEPLPRLILPAPITDPALADFSPETQQVITDLRAAVEASRRARGASA